MICLCRCERVAFVLLLKDSEKKKNEKNLMGIGS